MRVRSPRMPLTIPYSREEGCYSIRVSRDADDPAWDDFLEGAPDGHHAQTSCWGRARASIAWQPIRVVVTRDGQVVAGAQMVTRPMPFGGNLGFVHRGPVTAGNQAELIALVLRELLAMGRACEVRYLVVQPPPGAHRLVPELTKRNFRRGAFDIDHTATLRLDLTRDLDVIFSSMSKKCRKYIRASASNGITARRGTEADLPVFNHLKDVHSARLGYPRRSPGYYEQMWRALAPRGHIHLFIAEFEGEPVVAQLAITFGTVCRHMERTWSGEHPHLHPNEVIEWEAIKWAKSAGYQSTDFEGIEERLAQAVVAGGQVDADPEFSASVFKLKFGGAVVVDPCSYDYVYNPVLRFAYHCVPVSVMRSRWMRRLLFAFRETGS